MRKIMAALTAALMLAMPITAASGGVNGVIKLRPEMNFTAMGSGSTGSGSRPPTVGIGWDVSGRKPERLQRDTKVQLISQNIDMRSLTEAEIEDWYKNDVAPDGQPIFLTAAQEDGTYEISNVPEGRYYLVIIAGQADDGFSNPLRTRSGDALSRYLPDWDQYAMFVIGMNSCVVQEIEVRDGTMTRADYDFGAFAEK